MTPRKRLTLCVDDFGLHPGVNASVLRLASLGRVNATSVLVDGLAVAPGASELLAREAGWPGEVHVGLHLNLTEALNPPASPSGFDPVGLRSLIARCFLRRMDRAVLAAEVHRQCDRFETLFARVPDYVDGHQHVHTLPVIRETLLRVLLERYGGGLSALPWIRRTRPPRGDWRLKPRVIAALGDSPCASIAAAHGFKQNNHLLGVHDFTRSAAVYGRLMARWLAQAEDGDLLMTHPGMVCRTDPLQDERMAEHAWLAGEGFDQQLKAAGVVLQPPG